MAATLAIAVVMMVPAVPGTPYWAMYRTLPMIDHLRVPIRFFPIAQLMFLGLIAVYLTQTVSTRRGGTWSAAGVILLALLAGNVFLSPWYYEINLVAAFKSLLDKQ